MITSHLQSMYQQWQQGNENYVDDWVEFVELVSKESKMNQDDIIRELQKCHWFQWPKV